MFRLEKGVRLSNGLMRQTPRKPYLSGGYPFSPPGASQRPLTNLHDAIPMKQKLQNNPTQKRAQSVSATVSMPKIAPRVAKTFSASNANATDPVCGLNPACGDPRTLQPFHSDSMVTSMDPWPTHYAPCLSPSCQSCVLGRVRQSSHKTLQMYKNTPAKLVRLHVRPFFDSDMPRGVVEETILVRKRLMPSRACAARWCFMRPGPFAEFAKDLLLPRMSEHEHSLSRPRSCTRILSMSAFVYISRLVYTHITSDVR